MHLLRAPSATGLILALVVVVGSPMAHAQLALQIGGGQSDNARAVAVDAAGNFAIAGQFRDTVDFDPGPGVVSLSSPGTFTNYLASYTPSGVLRFVVPLGSGGLVPERGVAFDAAGNVFVTGWFTGIGDFDPGPDDVFLTGTDGNAFVASYDPTGAYRFAFNIGGDDPSRIEAGRAIVVDSVGNCYVAGTFPGKADFDPDVVGELLIEVNGITDAFVASYTPSGDVRFAFGLGGTSGDNGWGIAIDAADNIYVTGAFGNSADFDPGPLDATLTSAGQEDVFLASYTSSGAYRYALNVGGTSRDEGRSVDVDAAGEAFVTGFFRGTADFDPGVGTLELTSVQNGDLFVASYGSAGALRFAFAAGSTGEDAGEGVAVDGAGDVYVTGAATAGVDLDPGPGTALLPASGPDAFVARYSNTGAFESLSIIEAPSNADSLGYAIALDAMDRPHLVGDFSGANVDFDPGDGTVLLSSAGSTDGFFTNLGLQPSVPALMAPAALAAVAAMLGVGWRRVHRATRPR